MEITNPVPAAPAAHPHSKLWLLVTILVAVIAAALIWYFLYPKEAEPVAMVPETQKTVETKVDETLIAATEDLKTVNVDELKTAVDELKSTLDAFE